MNRQHNNTNATYDLADIERRLYSSSDKVATVKASQFFCNNHSVSNALVSYANSVLHSQPKHNV